MLDSTKFKAFTDDKINVTQIMIPVFDRVEKIVGKGDNAGTQHSFHLFPQCFPKPTSSWSSKAFSTFPHGLLNSRLCGRVKYSVHEFEHLNLFT